MRPIGPSCPAAAPSFGRISVLMFTTAGPTCFAIAEKPFDSVTGFGTCSGFASLLSTEACLALTRPVNIDPARTPAESVARIVKVGRRRPPRILSRQPCPNRFDESIVVFILVIASDFLLDVVNFYTCAVLLSKG